MSREHKILECIDSIKDIIPEGKYLEIMNRISDLYKKNEFTPHRIVYVVPTISHGTYANVSDHDREECECVSYHCRGELDCVVKSTIWPFVKISDVSYFNRSGDRITIPNKFPIKIHPVVLDLNLHETISLVVQTDAGDDVPDCDLKSLKLQTGTILILSVTPME